MNMYVDYLGEELVKKRELIEILHPDTGMVAERLAPVTNSDQRMRRGVKGALLYAMNYIQNLPATMKIKEGRPEEGKCVLVFYRWKNSENIEVHEGYYEGRYGYCGIQDYWFIFCRDNSIGENEVDFIAWTDLPEVSVE